MGGIRTARAFRVPPLCWCACLVLSAASPTFANQADRAPTLAHWLTAVREHEPGMRDRSVVTAGSWSRNDLVTMFSAIRRHDFPNAVLVRAAVLHADVLMLIPAQARGPLILKAGKRVQSTLLAYDGRQKGVSGPSTHLELGRELLNGVRPDPSKNQIVRAWYRGTAAHLAATLNLADAVSHLERGLESFPPMPSSCSPAAGCTRRWRHRPFRLLCDPSIAGPWTSPTNEVVSRVLSGFFDGPLRSILPLPRRECDSGE